MGRRQGEGEGEETKWKCEGKKGIRQVALKGTLRITRAQHSEPQSSTVPVIRNWEETGSTLWITCTLQPLLWEVLVQVRNAHTEPQVLRARARSRSPAPHITHEETGPERLTMVPKG